MFRLCSFVLFKRTLLDILPVDDKVAISVWSALLVPETNGVSKLVYHHVLVVTTVSNGKIVLSSLHHSDLAPATGK